MTKQTVNCAVCGKEMKQITRSHLASHGLTIEQYLTDYPDSPMVSEATLLKKSQNAAKANASRIGVPRSQEVRERISKTKKQQPATPWNKGAALTDQHKAEISQTRKQHISMGDIGHWNVGNTTPDATRADIASALQLHHSDATATKIEATIQRAEQLANDIKDLSMDIPFDVEVANTSNGLRQLQRIDKHIAVASTIGLTVLSSQPGSYRLQCNACQTEFEVTIQHLRESKLRNRTCESCPTCNPRAYKVSAGEREMSEYIAEIYQGTIIKNDRTALGGKEIDVYLKDLQLGFEYNGNYWHSANVHTDKHNINTKIKEATEAGIRIISILEDEWRDKRDICRSRIAQIIGKQQRRLYARKCTIRDVSFAECTDFLNANHIQGADRAAIRYGAYVADELVGVMTFKPTNFIKGGDGSALELSRFCVQRHSAVVGLAGKLFARFLADHDPDTVISYSDRRWNTGGVYQALGFVYDGITPPSYWYIAPGQYAREHRSRYMKHMLVAAGFDSSLTEKQIMSDRRYLTIWDAGTTKWIYVRK